MVTMEDDLKEKLKKLLKLELDSFVYYKNLANDAAPIPKHTPEIVRKNSS